MPEYCDNQKTGSDISPSQASKSADPFRSGPHQLLGALSPSLSLSLILVRSICPGHRFSKPTRWLTNSVFSNLAQVVLGDSGSALYIWISIDESSLVFDIVNRRAQTPLGSTRPAGGKTTEKISHWCFYLPLRFVCQSFFEAVEKALSCGC